MNKLSEHFNHFAIHCPHRVIDQRGISVCHYHDSSAGDCRFDLCPKIALTGRNSTETFGRKYSYCGTIDSSVEDYGSEASCARCEVRAISFLAWLADMPTRLRNEFLTHLGNSLKQFEKGSV